MKGSVYKNVTRAGTVSWRYQIIVGRDQNGQPVRESKSGFALEREADKAMRGNAGGREPKGHRSRRRDTG